MSLYSSSRSKSNPCTIFLRSALKLFCLVLHETVPRKQKVTNILWPQLQPTNFLLEILRVLQKYHQTSSFWKNYPIEVRNFKERGSKRYQKMFKKTQNSKYLKELSMSVWSNKKLYFIIWNGTQCWVYLNYFKKL